jgi:hypothetical protein
MFRSPLAPILAGAASVWLASASIAQQVCLPAPRLLTVMPMGGQVGTTVDVAITGESIEETTEFSPRRKSRLSQKPARMEKASRTASS